MPDFDHTDPVAAQDIYATLAVERARCPVLRSEKHDGFWAFTRYADVVHAAHDHEHYTTRQGVTIPALGLPAASVPLTTDPPEHKGYRRALLPYFTPAAVAGLEDAIRDVVVEHVEAFAGRGHADLVEELAAPVPCIVIALVLGLDRQLWGEFAEWVDGMEAASHVGDTETRATFAAKLYELLVSEVDRRKREPRDDLLTAIAQVSIDGADVADTIKYGMAQLILVAGHDTTVSGIGNLLRHLMEHPDLRARARTEPGLLDKIVEESLRFEAPLFALSRTVTEETAVEDTRLCPGDRVLLMYGSANRDHRRYPDPDSFDPLRTDRPPHVAFGYGRHRCLGEHLARLEMRIAAEEVLRRVPDYRLAPGATIKMRTALVRGPLALEVVWDRH
ncbi:cytochrome P450 [Amycolatopsis sp.]|uniref:cytochrome P450 n=1 Tax=Amycolatopsis sp. TaxID=37632 RepID=UPI002CE3D8D8|nr:cytochrome P450 [Amycolatopsis sp.]HVV08129.1 cytochrome P450 [Amycolatopsis sp.]